MTKLSVDGRVYEFDQDRLTNVECMAIEKVTGLTFGEWADALQKRSMLAVTALVWVVRKRDEPTLRFSDVEFNVASLDITDDEQPEEAGDAGKDDAATAS